MIRLLVLGALLAASCSEDGQEEHPRPPGAPMKWKVARHPNDNRLVFYLPEEWSKDVRVQGQHTVHSHGPEDDGFRPNVQIGWTKSDTKLNDYAERKIRSYLDATDVEVYDRGEAFVAGMRARYVVYGRVHSVKETGQRILIRHIDYYFVGHGHLGFLRGTSTARTFLGTYRALFSVIARRLRYEDT